MITKESYKQIQRHQVQYTGKKLMEHLAKYDLTPTTDIKAIRKEYKVKLFNQLLEADAGLKLKHGMLRTEEARQKLLEETINLDGYTELQEAEHLIMLYQRDFDGVYDASISGNSLKYHGITEDTFLTIHQASIKEALSGYVIVLDDNPTYQKLQKLQEGINELVQEGILRGNNNLYPDLSLLLRQIGGGNGVEIDDVYVHHIINKKK